MESKKSEPKRPLRLLIEKFDGCDDFRDSARIDYTLAEILFLTFCASITGSETYTDIVDFGEAKLEWLRKFLPYKNEIPSHDTIARILGILNTKQLEKVLIDFCRLTIKLPNGTLINIDGKKLRGSATKKEQQTKKVAGGKQAINMVNVYCSMFESCLASIRVCSKTGEKNALEDILGLLDFSDCLLTFDAGYCYTDVAEQVVDAKADYLIGLKENQPTLYTITQGLLSSSTGIEIHTDEQKNGHGRIEQRTCTMLNINNLDAGSQQEYNDIFSRWSGLKSLVKVVCQRTVIATGKTSAEERFYISSKKLSAKEANEIVRGHWKVENNLHWVLDAIMGEDRSKKRIGNSAANFSIIKKLAFNHLKNYNDPKVSMNRKMRKCAMTEKYFENVLGIS